MYYSFIGCLITVLLGWTISYLTGFSEDELYDENLLHPIARKMASLFPGAKRRYADESKYAEKVTGAATSHEMAHSFRQEKEIKNGTLNPAFTQDVQVEEPETYRTKLW